MRTTSTPWLTALTVTLLCFACAKGADIEEDASKAGKSSGTAGDEDEDVSTGGSLQPDMSGLPAPPNCGDGVLTDDEACDDHNTVSNDGCLHNCLQVELGFSCATPGEPCRRVARCGDGVAVLPELCDDGNKDSGDGCSSGCKVEIGFKCKMGIPGKCTPTTCGDGKIEGMESCEDGNPMPFDGCSGDCRNEPSCKSGVCESECGDGIVVNEDCDDGNNTDGDGCSAKCKVEKGFACQPPDLGDRMAVPIVLRDFRYGNPRDFQPGASGRSSALVGMVEPNLDSAGKPVYTGISDSLVTSKETFSQWYRDVKDVNHATASKLILWNNGKGAYVNRLGANGEQFAKTKKAYYCGNVGAEVTDAQGQPIPCTSKYASETDCSKAQAQGLEVIDCRVEGGNYVATIIAARVDGNPLFYPVDNDNFTPADQRAPAQFPGKTTSQSTQDEDTWYSESWDYEAGKPPHNFSFTSEVRYWFQYDGSKSYNLEFVGDDDVWVFINKKLAVDLGGIHTPIKGNVTLDASSGDRFDLKNGKVYEIAVFQAERQTSSSSYKLTLSGFSAAPSDCRPICGDGNLGIGEECDDGENKGGYGKCGPGCTLSAFCGDGVVQGEEDCDDGINNGDGHNPGEPCPSGCRYLVPIL